MVLEAHDARTDKTMQEERNTQGQIQTDHGI